MDEPFIQKVGKRMIETFSIVQCVVCVFYLSRDHGHHTKTKFMQDGILRELIAGVGCFVHS